MWRCPRRTRLVIAITVREELLLHGVQGGHGATPKHTLSSGVQGVRRVRERPSNVLRTEHTQHINISNPPRGKRRRKGGVDGSPCADGRGGGPEATLAECNTFLRWPPWQGGHACHCSIHTHETGAGSG